MAVGRVPAQVAPEIERMDAALTLRPAVASKWDVEELLGSPLLAEIPMIRASREPLRRLLGGSAADSDR